MTNPRKGERQENARWWIPLEYRAQLIAGIESDRGLPSWAASLRDALLAASPFWVSPEMSELVAHAAARMPDEVLQRTDLVEPNGFIVFEDPILIHGTPFDALMWSSDGSAMRAEAFDRAPSGRWLLSNLGRTWPFGLTLSGIPPEADPEKNAIMQETGIDFLRHLKTFFTLSSQRIGVRSKSAGLPRHVRRRLERAGGPISNVEVVTLRRHKASRPGAESERDWSHRWIVGGHWRNQYLPSVGDHRLQWISPYVKGPTDKPLVAKQRLYRWIR